MHRFAAIPMLIIAMLVTAGCGEFGSRFEGEENPGADEETARITDAAFDEEAREADGCTEIEEYDSEGRSHVEDPEQKLDFKTNPPTSGDHSPQAVEWGVYDEPQADAQTVHNLEHGHVVISYKGLSDEERETLLDQASVDPFHLLVQPRPDNPKDGVYYSAWTVQLYCETPSAAGLQQMIDEHRDEGPELLTNDPSMGAERDE